MWYKNKSEDLENGYTLQILRSLLENSNLIMKPNTLVGHILAVLPFTLQTSAQDSRFPTLQLSNDTHFNFQLLTSLGIAIAGGADINPILGIAQDIIPGNRTSFSQHFQELAFTTKAQAEDPANAYDPINVRDTWFSTSNYFRNADTYNRRDWTDPLIQSLWDEQTYAFDQAIAALPIPGERIRIPVPDANFTVEAIWYGGSKDANLKLPTYIIGNGYDAAQEDSYHNHVAPALARGWNAITYEGPGQCTARRNSNAGFIPDWERVLNPVVDWVLANKSDVVDETKVALLGNSFGGYLGARAAAFEPRLAATVLIGGVWDAYAGFIDQFSPELIAIFEAGNFTQFDEEILRHLDNDEFETNEAWMWEHGMWAFMTHSPSEFLNRGKAYSIADVVHQINHPVFVGDAELETYFRGQPQMVADALGEKATLHVFNGTAGYHCQTGAGQELTRTIFAWLNETLYR